MKSKEEKAAYDRKYRKKNRAMLKAKKKAAYSKWGPAHREEERTRRKARAKEHIEYCRQPGYRAWKKKYDEARRSKKFAEYAEVHNLLLALIKEIKKQMPDRFERYAQAQRFQWSPLTQARRRMKRANFNEQSDGL